MFQKSVQMGMRMDEKADEGTEVVGQSSMEELDYEASDNLEEESMEMQSENNTSSNGATEETVKAENDETENVLATAVTAGDSVEMQVDGCAEVKWVVVFADASQGFYLDLGQDFTHLDLPRFRTGLYTLVITWI